MFGLVLSVDLCILLDLGECVSYHYIILFKYVMEETLFILFYSVCPSTLFLEVMQTVRLDWRKWQLEYLVLSLKLSLIFVIVIILL